MYKFCRVMLVFSAFTFLLLVLGAVVVTAPVSIYVIVGVLVVRILKQGKKYLFDSHGTARWANEDDVRFLRTGINLGPLETR